MQEESGFFPQNKGSRHMAAARQCVSQVITCTFFRRWVVSSLLYRSQRPAADGSREVCEPHTDPTSPITKCEDKKDPSHRDGEHDLPVSAYSVAETEEK